MTNAELDKFFTELLTYEWFTEGELNLIISINGYNEETLNDCLFARYGLRNYEQFLEEVRG